MTLIDLIVLPKRSMAGENFDKNASAEKKEAHSLADNAFLCWKNNTMVRATNAKRNSRHRHKQHDDAKNYDAREYPLNQQVLVSKMSAYRQERIP